MDKTEIKELDYAAIGKRIRDARKKIGILSRSIGRNGRTLHLMFVT